MSICLLTYKTGKNEWINNLDLFYAMLNTTSQGTRKNDDRIDYYTKWTHTSSNRNGALV